MKKIEQSCFTFSLNITGITDRKQKRGKEKGDIIEASQSTKLQCKTESPLSVSGELKG